jgi:hypothetical protein
MPMPLLVNNPSTGGNSVLPQLAVTCKIEAECSYQAFVLSDSEVLRNRQLRQHANRYVQRRIAVVTPTTRVAATNFPVTVAL